MKRTNLKVLLILSLFVAVTLSGCGKKEEKTSDNTTTHKTETGTTTNTGSAGKEIFYRVSDVTGLKCADCHSDGTNDNITFTKYHSSIKGAHKRTSTYFGMFKGEDVLKNAGGAGICLARYLKIKEPFTPEEINALNDYYKSVSKGDEPAELVYTTIALPKPDKTKLKDDQTKIALLTADAVKGEKFFNDVCAFCHSDKSKIKHVPSLFKKFEGNFKSIIYNIRMGSKVMPFYSYESISNQDVADLTEFILKKNNMK